MKTYLNKTYLVVLGAWLFLTAFVDFFVIPTAFRQLNDIFIAGELGLRVFGALNLFEISFSAFLLIYSILLIKDKPSKKSYLIVFINILLIAISCFYFFYLTEKIAVLTDLWKTSIAMTEQALVIVKKEHNFYHSLYIRTDSVKLILIFIGLIFSFKDKGEVQ